MKRPILPLLLVLALPLVGQNQIYVPDNTPAVGTCNAYPFGSTSFTYVSRIPASFMDPSNTYVDDVWFAPCNSGQWSAPDVQIGIGHVQNPIQNPFNFPTISGGMVTALGDFSDLTVLWDSSVQSGPFSWAYSSGTWSPLGFGPTGGTGFTWDQTNDVGFFITLNNATGTSSMHRTSTEPFRLYSSGVYQSPLSSGSGNSGLKISFTLAVGSLPSVSPYGAGCGAATGLPPTLGSTQLPYIGTTFNMDIAMASPGAPTYVFLSSGPAQTPLGFGCDLLLDFPGLILFANAGVSPLGPVPADALGNAVQVLAIPNAPILANLSLYCQGAIIDAGAPLGIAVTNGLQLVFN